MLITISKMIHFADNALSAAPASVRALLWDLDPTEVRVLDHQSSIIPRLIIADEPEVLRWVRRAVGDQAIRRSGNGLLPLVVGASVPWI